MNTTVSKGPIARFISSGWPGFICLIALSTAIVFATPLAFAKKGGNGGGGSPGPFTKFSGTVTNSLTGQGVAGATVTLTATSNTVTLTTDGSGNFADNKVQVGSYTMDVTATNYTDSSQPVSLLKGRTTVDVALVPKANVIVTASVPNGAPGDTLEATGTYMIMDGSVFVESHWTQGLDAEGNLEGVPVGLGNPDKFIDQTGTHDTDVTLGTEAEYAAHLIKVLEEPPILETDLPDFLKLQPYNEIEKGLQSGRNQVVAINPFAEEKAADVPLQFAVTTTSGTYTANATVAAALHWVVNTGLRTVPRGIPVLLFAKDRDDPTDITPYNWTIQRPGSSNAELNNATTQTPWFTPDENGTYVVTETTGSGANLEIHAGSWHGVIRPDLTLTSVQTGDGRPVGDPNCTGCHDGITAPDKFTPWRQTGHAEAFYDNMAASTHFGESCFACHTVGFNKGVAGIDSTPNYQNFLDLLTAAQHATPPTIGDVWEQMLMPEEDGGMPDTARAANVQCENCHGPQDYTGAHRDQPGAPRVSLGAEVCGSCHGEPARHGRFQQWQLSSHADYDLARERGAGGSSPENCGRCHSGNGFVDWSKHDFDPSYEYPVSVMNPLPWDEDTVVPQTCAACHDPHDTGTTSGNPEDNPGANAKVRLMGDTNELVAAFVATDVGKAATCMTCHNSRAEVPRTDANWASLTDSQKTGTPHHGVQADLLMGQNAYFMTSDDLVRGKHSLVPNVCVTCHMEKTPKPDLLAYNQGGTNHTFAADPNICSDCHSSGSVTADNTNTIVTGYMSQLRNALGDAYKRLMTAHYPVNVGSSCGIADSSSPITDVVWNYGGFRGVQLDITVGGTTCTGRGPSSITVDSGMPGEQTLQGLTLVSGNDAVLKALWNYGLLYEDSAGATDHPGARGVHNPDFSIKALTRATTAVQAVSP